MATSEELILKTLSRIDLGGKRVDLVASGAVRHMEVDDGAVRLLLASSDPPEALRTAVQGAVAAIPGVERCEVQVQSLMPMNGPAPQPGPAWADRRGPPTQLSRARHK